MKKIIVICLLVFSAQSLAEDSTPSKHRFYVGAGKADSGSTDESDKTPWSLGYLYQPKESKILLGFDFSREGTSFDSTSGKYNDVNQSFAFNFLFGREMYSKGDWNVGVNALLGVRETEKYCNDSYLGYQCYANAAPEEEYDVNYGGMLHASFKNALVGARITGESSQLILGFTF